VTDEQVIPATPEEYRRMLDDLGLYSRPTETGFDVVYLSPARNKISLIVKRNRGWWDFCLDDELQTLIFSSEYASEKAAQFIREHLRMG
jgi:hypothetical protein